MSSEVEPGMDRVRLDLFLCALRWVRSLCYAKERGRQIYPTV